MNGYVIKHYSLKRLSSKIVDLTNPAPPSLRTPMSTGPSTFFCMALYQITFHQMLLYIKVTVHCMVTFYRMNVFKFHLLIIHQIIAVNETLLGLNI